jgi:hypothetical protein
MNERKIIPTIEATISIAIIPTMLISSRSFDGGMAGQNSVAFSGHNMNS